MKKSIPGICYPTLAIISPNQNAYSETFIQAHRSIPNVNIKYYYGGVMPRYLEGKGSLFSSKNNIQRIYSSLKRKLTKSTFSPQEYGLLQSLRHEKVDCVLAEYGSIGVAVLKVCKYLNLPLIVYFRGYDASVYDTVNKLRNSYVELFEYASKVMAVSHDIISRLQQLGCPKDKITYHSSAPGAQFFNITPDYQSKTVFALGRFVDKKAPYYTVLAFRKVLEIHPDAQLIFAGDGPLHNTVKNLISYYGMDKSVSLVGPIKNDVVPEYFQKCRLFAQHSVLALNGDSEGTPLTIMEASAAGLPVVSTLHAGIPDVIVDKETGFLVPEHDVLEMSEKIIEILNDGQLAERLGKAGRERIKTHFNLAERLNSLSKIIHELK